MSKEIYNEGRVVGYSAYELYVRHALAEDPTSPPASELEWLASTIATGSSMLLRIDPDLTSGPHYRDIPFPWGTRLCAANTIIGSYFIGNGHFEGNSVWATKIVDYGPLISNTSSKNPVGDVQNANSVPTQAITYWTDTAKNKLRDYMKIIDSIIIQPGKWTANANMPPAKDFSPTLANVPTIRIFFNDKITTSFCILLTGFTIRSVVQGVSGTDTAVNTGSPLDGDFLGPAAYPWANKVVFSVPNAFINYFMFNTYSRELPSAADAISINSEPIIDMASSNLSLFYNSNYSDSAVSMNVTKIDTTKEDASVLTVYPRSDVVPAALYGTQISSEGETHIYPIDIHAPGTIKMYHGDNGTRAKQLESAVPNNYALIRDSESYVVKQLEQSVNSAGKPIAYVTPVSDDYVTNYSGAMFIKLLHQGWLGANNNGDNDAGEASTSFKTVIVYRRIFSIIPQKIMDEFAFSADDPRLQFNGSLYDDWSSQMVNDLRDIQGKNNQTDLGKYADPDEVNKYKFLMIGEGEISKTSEQSYCFYPVRIADNVLDVCVPYFFYLSELKKDLNFAGKTDYLGTRAEYSAGGRFNWTYDSSKKIDLHPKVYTLSKTTKYRHDEAYAPNLGNTLDEIMQAYETTKLTDVFTLDHLTEVGVHSSYHNLSLWEFIQEACKKDVTKNRTSSSNKKKRSSGGKGLSGTRYMYKNTISGISPDNPLKATSSNSIAFNFDIDSGDLFKETVNYFPNVYLDNSGTDIYIANGQSGNHITKAVSLVNDNLDDLPLTGSSGKIQLSDEGLNWFQLLSALGNDKSIDILGDKLRSLRDSLSSDFFMNSLTTTSCNYNNMNPYTKITLDVFGFTSKSSPDVITTVGSITMMYNPNFTGNVAGKHWYQRFKVTDTEELQNLIQQLKPSAVSGYNTLKVSIVPRCGYISRAGSDVNNGAPRSNTMIQMTCYINLTNGTNFGKGILYVRQDGGVGQLSSSSQICSYALTTENATINYDRDTINGWEWSE